MKRLGDLNKNELDQTMDMVDKLTYLLSLYCKQFGINMALNSYILAYCDLVCSLYSESINDGNMTKVDSINEINDTIETLKRNMIRQLEKKLK